MIQFYQIQQIVNDSSESGGEILIKDENEELLGFEKIDSEKIDSEETVKMNKSKKNVNLLL